MVEDPKKAVADLVGLVGKRRAREILESVKVNESTAEKLVGGRYVSDVGYLLMQKIFRAREIAHRKQTA